MHQANVMHTMALRPESMEGTGSEASWLQMACYAAPGWAKSEAGGGILAGKMTSNVQRVNGIPPIFTFISPLHNIRRY